jgi:hypothetical protein
MSAGEVLAAYQRGRRDFHLVNIDDANMAGVDLRAASFYEASMRNVDLSGAQLTYIQLKGADLTRASLQHASINASDLIGADFTGANLAGADFTGASLIRATLEDADLSASNLGNASLAEASVQGARLRAVMLSGTYLDNMDLRPFCDEKELRHHSPSYIDARAVMRSYTHPGLKQFLVDCGVPQLFAEYMIDCAKSLEEPLLRGLMQRTFISYGAPDEAFARRLYDALRQHGVVAYFFPETARVGERISNELFRQIQENDRVLLICSENSLNRQGVINEIQETLDREARDGGASYLLPIMLDRYVLSGWREEQPILAQRIGRRIIADFTRAEHNDAAFSGALSRVVDALKIKRVDS